MLYIGDNFFEKICIRFSFFSFFRSPKKKKKLLLLECTSNRNMFSTHLTRIFRCIVIKLKFLRIVRLDFIRFTVWLIIKRNNKIWRERTMLWNCYKDFNKNNFFSIEVFIFNWLLRDFNFYESSVSLSFFLLFLLRLLLCIHLNICNLIVNFVFLFKIVNIFFFISDQFYIFHF